MNSIIKELVTTEQPKITTLDDNENRIYKAGLMLLSTFINEDFLDIPRLPDDKYSTDGLFYEIPYFDSEQLLTQSNQRMMLVVYKIENKSSWCPLRIDFKLDDINNFSFIVYDQSGERTKKKEMVTRENGQYYTEIQGHDKMKLSELISL